MTRRFEFIGGTSAKFWEVGVTGASVTVRYGRLGTQGQSQIKSLADAAARREADRRKDRQGVPGDHGGLIRACYLNDPGDGEVCGIETWRAVRRRSQKDPDTSTNRN